ncbi:major facilitator superfamily transporter [Fusarium subglutinans]|uniref:Major facilitator superfamily transporter n=1 Tax=Gibberella subglutinans TaxID=42677 RepID=A0A8H5UQD9_GIBSU|nr:major facilitator superfamily transporter [Fusarium subglutinans]KAF5593540.1 major facilitator superfamily transporter [Fusarium subglutinans]
MDNVQHSVSESTPLLQPDLNGSALTRSPPAKDRVIQWRTAWQCHFSQWSALYICSLFILLVDVPNFLSEVPKLRMLELGLCRDYYAATDPSVIGHDGSIPEHLCKVHEIQSALAKMRGILGMIEGIPGLILAIPYGVLADSKGRRLVTGLSLLGFVLRDIWAFSVLYFHQVFPVRAVYAAPAFLVLGGGSTVISPMIMAIIAAAIPEASRTRAFFWVQVVLLITELIAPPLGAILMKALGPHFAFLTAVPLEALAFVVLGFIPNTKSSDSAPSDIEVTEGEEAPSANDVCEETMNDENPSKNKVLQALTHLSHDVRHGAPLVVAKMARPMLELILQYMSVRFGWPLAKTALLLSIQAAAQILLFAGVLPQVNVWLISRMKTSSAANLALTRVSIIILAVGSLCMGIATAVPAFIIAFFGYTLGNGFSSALRSLLTTMVHPDHLSLLFTAIAVFEGISTIGASPLLGLSFSVGLDIGGMAVSLPFFVASVLYTLAAVLLVSGMSTESCSTEA